MLSYREWNVIGPFPEDWHFFSALENTTTRIDIGATGMYRGLVGGENWELAPGYWRNYAEPKNIRAYFERRDVPVENCSCYVATEIVASSDCWISISLRYDDAVKLWINGEKVFEDPEYRHMGADEVVVETQLNKGVNFILLRVIQGREAWAFSFSARQIEAPAWMAEADRIADLLQRRGLLPDMGAINRAADEVQKALQEMRLLAEMIEAQLEAHPAFKRIDRSEVKRNFLDYWQIYFGQIDESKDISWRLISELCDIEREGVHVRDWLSEETESGPRVYEIKNGWAIRYQEGGIACLYRAEPEQKGDEFDEQIKLAGLDHLSDEAKEAIRNSGLSAEEAVKPANVLLLLFAANRVVEAEEMQEKYFRDAIGGPIQNGEFAKLVELGVKTPEAFLEQAKDLEAFAELSGIPKTRLEKAAKKAKDWIRKNR